MRVLLVVVVLATVILPAAAVAQPHEPFASIGKGWGLDPLLMQPGTHVYLDNPPDVGEINPFPLSVDLQWAGIDLVKYLDKGKLRFGASTSFASIVANDSPAGAITVSFFVQIGEHSRLNFGSVYVTSPQHQGGSGDKTAWFVGMSFPTKLTAALR